MDPFQQLPAELVLYILHHTGDFLGVDSLLQVSPQVNAVFQFNSLQITEDLLASCPTTAHDLHQLFHITALIHSPSFNPVNFEDLATAISTACSGTSFNNDTARLMISIAAQIQHLACACLSTAWDNFQIAHRAILPEEWQRRCGPFSWIEEFRVHRALWQLRIYSDLWNLVSAEKRSPVLDPYPSVRTSLSPSKKWPWPSSEADKITTLAIFERSSTRSFELHTVADLLRHLGAPSLRDAETPTIECPYFIPPPLPLFSSLHIPGINITRQLVTWPSPRILEETALNFHWGRSPQYASSGSEQAVLYVCMQVGLSFLGGYPTGLDDMRPFYRLGVFVWDTWRMHQMGYLDVAHRSNVERITQELDWRYICPSYEKMQVLQKRWCALVGRKTGGSKRMQEVMQGIGLF